LKEMKKKDGLEDVTRWCQHNKFDNMVRMVTVYEHINVHYH
jgi:hypothetical protein